MVKTSCPESASVSLALIAALHRTWALPVNMPLTCALVPPQQFCPVHQRTSISRYASMIVDVWGELKTCWSKWMQQAGTTGEWRVCADTVFNPTINNKKCSYRGSKDSSCTRALVPEEAQMPHCYIRRKQYYKRHMVSGSLLQILHWGPWTSSYASTYNPPY